MPMGAARDQGEGQEGEEAALEGLQADLERFPVAGGTAWEWASELLRCAAQRAVYGIGGDARYCTHDILK